MSKNHLPYPVAESLEMVVAHHFGGNVPEESRYIHAILDEPFSLTDNGATATPVRQIIELTDAENIDTDLSSGYTFRVVLGGDRTLANPTGPKIPGKSYFWIIKQDATGGRTLAFGSDFEYISALTFAGIKPDPDAKTVIEALYDGEKFLYVEW